MSDEELLTAPKTMVNWFARGEQAEQEVNLEIEIIKSLYDKPLDEPRVHQTFLCRWCLRVKSQVPKSFNEYVQLRAIVAIPDNVKDPPICTECYDTAIGSFNRRVSIAGSSNSGHPNIVLQQLG